MSNLKISLCQTNIIWQDPIANRIRLEELFATIKDSDLLILPEMFSTGFSMDSITLAESMTGPTINWMQEQSLKWNFVIAGSLIVKDQGQYFNRLVWVEPNQNLPKYYDKKHLFRLADENKHYSPGTQKLILEYKSWKIALFICYDLRFPVWSRNTEGVDLMIYIANWPEKRSLAWNMLLPARAIENQCFVAGVNRVGQDGKEITYAGASAVYDFEGKNILNLESKEAIVPVELNKHDLNVYRRAYPFLLDADPFQIIGQNLG